MYNFWAKYTAEHYKQIQKYLYFLECLYTLQLLDLKCYS